MLTVVIKSFIKHFNIKLSNSGGKFIIVGTLFSPQVGWIIPEYEVVPECDTRGEYLPMQCNRYTKYHLSKYHLSKYHLSKYHVFQSTIFQNKMFQSTIFQSTSFQSKMFQSTLFQSTGIQFSEFNVLWFKVSTVHITQGTTIQSTTKSNHIIQVLLLLC